MSQNQQDPWQSASAAFIEFCKTIAALRDPKSGCPWDLEQDHESLRRYMIEEAYEAAEAMAAGDDGEIQDELGDVLLQVVLNAQVARDRGAFAIEDVVNTINAKMIRRHPHVFADADRSLDAIKDTWQQIKAEEQAKKQTTPAPERSHVFAKAYGTGPSTLQAYKIGKIAATIAFDWSDPKAVMQQLESEIEELKEEIEKPQVDQARVASELGDVYFTLAQVCRHFKLSPEVVAMDANAKFLARFLAVETLAQAEGLVIETLTSDQLERLWQQAKAREPHQAR